ncbi:MAG: cysteine--tRNA ligase [Desulfobulbus propionicus]|nr:MAG: cysteine--tRNA ligase [Desulfobulbus propionicus]
MKITELIGNTPLVALQRMTSETSVPLLVKLESSNPGGSIKDRVALSMVEAAEKSGELTRDKILLEATSGNTGIGMAMVCAAKQYRCQLIMPESASIERRLIMQAYGAELILTPAERATDGAIEKAYSLAREHPERYFLADQYNNPANWMAHYNSTGPEIWDQTAGQVTDVVVTLGTSGTAMGLSKWFREYHPAVRVTAIEPYLGHKIQGLKNMKESYRPGIFDKSLPHAIINVADEDAFATVRRLAAEEGIFAGMSGGAGVFAGIARAHEMEQGLVVVVLPDGGERYLSTPLFVQEQKTTKEALQLRFYNTMTRKKEVFEPVSKERVTLYSCGPTAYEPPNVAHLRRLVVSDMLVRYLGFRGYNVESYMNITDLDDNTIAGAEASGLSLKEFTGQYIQEFHQAAEMLSVLPATGYPLASEHVEDMLEITHKLIHKGYAYEKLGSIYFDISKFKKYGRLSRVDLSKIRVGRTVDLDNYEKDNPRDFTLLKRSTLAELKRGIFFETDWGNVRPGWHIECSAMSTRYLGETLDIHTASQDLIFPHHENEIAIAEALTGKALANFWIHSGLVLRGGRKMSQDAGNIVTLNDILERGFTARDLRFMLQKVHYSKPFHFSFKRLESAVTSLKRLDAFTRKLVCLSVGLPHPRVAAYISALEQQFTEAMDDDLNISGALGALFLFIKKLNPVLQDRQLDRKQKKDVLEVLQTIDRTLGIMQLEEYPLTPEIDKLIRQREQARQIKDWVAADSVREELLRQGVTVLDTVGGTIWEKSGRTR